MMKKIKNINIEKLIFISLLWWGVPILVILYILDLIFNKKKITYIDILMYLLIILGIISTICALDVNKSIYGEVERNEGLLSLLSYYFILLNLKNMSNEKYKNIIIKTIVILGIVQIVYSFFQVYTNFSFIIHFAPSYVAFGLCGHPNFFGSYMVILSSFMFSMYMLENKRKYLILASVFFMGICLCASTGPLLSFILMIVFFSIFCRINYLFLISYFFWETPSHLSCFVT